MNGVYQSSTEKVCIRTPQTQRGRGFASALRNLVLLRQLHLIDAQGWRTDEYQC